MYLYKCKNKIYRHKRSTNNFLGINLNRLLEIKTNIGWDRPNISLDEPWINIEKRVAEISNNFKIARENIIYVFEDHGNVSSAFSGKFWNSSLQQSVAKTTEFPYSIIYPLFNATDPYYWRHEKGFNRNINYRIISDEQILSMAENNIVTPFEVILEKIKLADNNNNRVIGFNLN